ncbi:MAG TPA: hypothetical protein PLC15_02590 [Candidatus Obscuribacter sp.]|nr:hypothetical protein [Candidatus Obscuribacter sp.]HNB14236.1 hypothetical protein [Candidatus Obscuribacter sp.]
MTTLSKQQCIDAVKQVVANILNDFGVTIPNIGPKTIPHKIEQFDSDIGIFGTVMVSDVTGIEVPLDQSLFSDKKGNLLSIEQAAERLVELQAKMAKPKRSQDGEVGVA